MMNSPDALIPLKLSASPIQRTATFLFLAVLGALLITASAKIKVPMWPVDISMQTFAIFLLAAIYGFRLGTTTILLYLFQGAMGFPVFQGTPERGIGLSYMVGPTGGYLFGFVAMTMITGWAADRGWWRNPLKIGGSMLLGECVLLFLGTLWLMHLFGVRDGFAYGVGPFIVSDFVKLALAAGLASMLGNFTRKLLSPT